MENKVLETFLDLVKISSPSRKEEDIANYIKERINKLGLEVIEDDCGSKINGNSGNLIIKVPGNKTTILWDAHMDTVMPCEKINPIVENGVVFSDRTSVLGADDKSGIAAMLCAVETILKQKLPHPTIYLVFSVCEEDGLQGVKHLDYSLFQDVLYAYVLDGEGSIGSVVTKTPYGCKGTLEVIGKEAHAGVCPEAGVNALQVASQALSKLPMGRVNPFLTCNIGKITGGNARNVVMGKISMEFEARGYNLQELKAFVKQYTKVFHDECTDRNAQFKETICFGTPGYTLQETDTILLHLKETCHKHDFTYKEEMCGGGSNANVYRMHNINAICLGTHMQSVHSVDEHIEVKDLLSLYELLLAISNSFA